MTKTRRRKVWTVADSAAAWDWIRDQLVAGIKPEVSRMSLPEWAELHRVIPPGLSSMPGRFSWDVTPYLEDIADDLSETSPVREVAVIKGAQIGFTVGVLENWMLYTIDQAPGPMLYVAQSQQAAEQNMDQRIGPAIQLSGLGPKIFSQAKSKGSRKTGDTDQAKQFPGGFINAIGPNMGARMRSTSYQKGAFDELDAWLAEVGTATGRRKREGSTLEILKLRFAAFATTMKICYGSTPLEKGSSLIEPLFEMGDQRLYHVPCKHCGELQPLEWERLKFDRWAKVQLGDEPAVKVPRSTLDSYREEDGWRTIDENMGLIQDSVHYECRACGGHWTNADKVDFLRSERRGGRARWVPTAEPRRPGMRSYHIPSLLSPVGFWSWEEMAQSFIEAGSDPTKLQDFWNLQLGRTWTVTGSTPDYTRVMLRRENEFDPSVWPDGARFVTIGADVQRGEHARIEAEVVAWGRNKESWSMGYYVFHGDTSNLDSPAWTNLADLITREHAGHMAMCTLVDSGDGEETDIVYAFCDKMQGQAGMVMPSKGDSHQEPYKKLYMIRKLEGWSLRRVDIQTNQLKEELYQHLRREAPTEGFVPMGYCHFPGSYTERFFKGLTAEEKHRKKMPNGGYKVEWRKIKGRGRNEPLDCRVYAMAGMNVVRGTVLEELGLEDETVTWEMFWNILEANG